MKLIVGLGNPGLEYKNTRHNVGFMLIDEMVSALGGTYKLQPKLKSEIYKTNYLGNDVIFCKPMTYMNLSGEAVHVVMDYYKVALEDVIIIHDDLDLPLGKIRIREKGSHGGHNGMRNIISLVGRNDIKRIRIGIDKKENVVDYVLGKFKKEEMEIIQEDLAKAKMMLDDYLTTTFANFMNKYNTNE